MSMTYDLVTVIIFTTILHLLVHHKQHHVGYTVSIVVIISVNMYIVTYRARHTVLTFILRCDFNDYDICHGKRQLNFMTTYINITEADV